MVPAVTNRWQVSNGLPGLGGVFNSANLALYGYSHLNPLIYTDPDGRAPNQAGVTDPSVILAQIQTLEQGGLTRAQILSRVSETHGTNKDRYFYTERYGWVDVRHFAKAAELTSEGASPTVVEAKGFALEVVQWLTEWGNDYRSGFSPEDIPSNAAGARFGANLNAKESLSAQFQNWLKAIGGRNANDPIANKPGLPLTDPSDRGGKNRGSSNPTSAGPGAIREPLPEIPSP